MEWGIDLSYNGETTKSKKFSNRTEASRLYSILSEKFKNEIVKNRNELFRQYKQDNSKGIVVISMTMCHAPDVKHMTPTITPIGILFKESCYDDLIKYMESY